MIENEVSEMTSDNSEDPYVFGLADLRLVDFRNYVLAEATLSPGFNVIAGPNAQGKTNFLEAIYLLSTARLLRGQRDAEAIREGAGRSRVEGTLLGSSTSIGVDLAAGVRKRAQLNGLSLPRASDLLGRMPSVCVSTVDMEIVRGEPSERRLFIDLEMSALYPAYLRDLTHYKRALEQRNALLKDSREWMKPAETFEVWEEQLAKHGSALRKHRQQYLEILQPSLAESHRHMGQGEALEVRYDLRDPATESEDLLRALAATRGQDVARGSTSPGPHRDDLAFTIDGRDVRLYGSQGQQRTAVIALKMATLEVTRAQFGAPPLLLLDDIFSDLDLTRRENLVKLVIAKAGQAVLTCTEAAAVGPEILDLAKVFEVRSGSIEAR